MGWNDRRSRSVEPGANTLAVFAVRERADGAVALAEAYVGDGNRAPSI